jgi:ParB/RepB/Spo0J family partition protein
MMARSETPKVELIPLDQIEIANPRVRNKRAFKEIVANIAELGLKKPVTVTMSGSPTRPMYRLVCGQGRLEAFRTLGQKEIPAFVVDADNERGLVMSLVENLARRQHRAIDLLADIEGLKKRGYSEPEIARKTGLTVEYVRGVIRLLTNGEHRLLSAVEAGQMPVSVAVEIAESDDDGVQRVLREAYEGNVLRGNRLTAVKRLIEQRRRKGKRFRGSSSRRERPLSVNALLRTYQDDVDKKRMLTRKADATKDCLIFVTEALRTLLRDENFVTLLRAEGLDTFPKQLTDRLSHGAEV